MKGSQTPMNRCWPIEEWPPEDRAAWATAIAPGEFLEAAGVAENWSASTRTMNVNGYGRYLNWLAQQGQLDPTSKPSARVTRELAGAFKDHLTAVNAPLSVQTRIRQLGNMMRALAPEKDWKWLLRGANRLLSQATPAKNKRSRMKNSADLVNLGLDLMRRATLPGPLFARQRALLYRDGLIIALLSYRPVRASNLAAIQLGKNLIQQNGFWRIVFSKAETKTGILLELTFPDNLLDKLVVYLREYRPVLLGAGTHNGHPATNGLWIGSSGRMLGQSAIAHQIRDRTKAAFGRSINSHLFRDHAATLIAIEAPEHVRDIKAILGHARQATSEAHYNQAQALEAGRRYQVALAGQHVGEIPRSCSSNRRRTRI